MKRFGLKKISLLKIDIEGSEKEVFENNVDEWLPAVQTMVLELHDNVKKGCTSSLIHALRNTDYTLEPLHECIIVRM
jgi:hypothetical protein